MPLTKQASPQSSNLPSHSSGEWNEKRSKSHNHYPIFTTSCLLAWKWLPFRTGLLTLKLYKSKSRRPQWLWVRSGNIDTNRLKKEKSPQAAETVRWDNRHAMYRIIVGLGSGANMCSHARHRGRKNLFVPVFCQHRVGKTEKYVLSVPGSRLLVQNATHWTREALADEPSSFVRDPDAMMMTFAPPYGMRRFNVQS